MGGYGERALLAHFAALVLVGGCSIQLAKPTDWRAELRAVPRLDLENGPVFLEPYGQDANTFVLRMPEPRVAQQGLCRVDYDRFYFDIVKMVVVKGRLDNGRLFPVWLDTGYPGWLLTNGVTIRENDIPILPLGVDDWTGAREGVCYVERLQVASAVLEVPCQYLQLRWEAQVLGVPIWRQKGFIVGLSALRQFGCVVFDNDAKQAQFLKGRFEPDGERQWNCYDLRVDGHIYVGMPVAGVNMPLKFDSCGYYDLVLSEGNWEKIRDEVRHGCPREVKARSGFLGRFSSSKVTVRDITIGEHQFGKMDVLIVPQSQRNLPCDYVSLTCFKKAVVAIDFKNDLFWVGY